MKLRGVEYGTVFCAPGARGFFGEGYWWHPWAKVAGLTWKNTTFVAKTATAFLRKGNLDPAERIPRCIVVKPVAGLVLNAVGLTNPGMGALVADGRWQERDEPFMISVMTVGDSEEARAKELEILVLFLRSMKTRAPWALQVNLGCPNTGHPDEVRATAARTLDVLSVIGVPLVANVSVAAPVDFIQEVARHPACEALWVANTVPWGDPRIDWQRWFGTNVSPLEARGFTPGGLSGRPCLPLAIERVRQLRTRVTMPIVAGNGIQHPEDAKALRRAGADGVALGVIGMVRPWRMQAVIREGSRDQGWPASPQHHPY